METWEELKEHLYYYRATVASNYDGDTIRLRVDAGFSMGLGTTGKGEPFRLYGINAPEIRGADKLRGKEAKKALADLVEDDQLIIKTVKAGYWSDKKGKYGRYLATLYIEADDGGILDVNAWMVREGFAVEKEY